MTTPETISQRVKLWGYVLLAIAAISVASDLAWRTAYGLPLPVPVSMGVVIANASVALTGFVVISIANALRSLETRLDKLDERDKE